MTSLIYNAATSAHIRRTAAALPHALLLEGASGVGLATIARSLAGRQLAGYIQPTDINGAVDTSEKGVIRVPQIRELIAGTRGKTIKAQVYIIDDADKMNVQAQNAFLKLLEEPTPNIHFILTSHRPHKLLPTVLSRVQRLAVRPISDSDSRRFITKLGVKEPRKIEQLLFLAAGRPAELTRLIQNDALFATRAAIMADARDFVQAAPYQRALVVSRYYNDRAAALTLVELAQSIITFSLAKAPSPALVHKLDALTTTYERIAANGNTRLQLMNFVLQ